MKTVLSKRSDIIDFGKHKGSRVSDVIKEDPQWLEWCIQNTDRTDFDIPLSHEIQQRAMAQKRRYEEERAERYYDYGVDIWDFYD